MKSLILTISIFLFAINYSFAQLSKEVPNYILAENSNFVVNIITMVDLGVHKKSNYIETLSFNRKERINPAEYASPDEGLFNSLAFMITKEFEKLNMHPAAFMNTDMTKMQDAEFMKEMNKQYLDIKPGFVVNIVCMDWEKEKRAFKKNKLELKKVKPVGFSIGRYGETNPSKTFVLRKMNMSLGAAFEELEKLISKKPDSYFLKNMEINEELFTASNFDDELIDKMLKENESIEKFPEESLLKENEILVSALGKKGDAYYKSSLKQLEKYYPYKFKLVDQEEYTDYIKKGYKYLLVAKSYLIEKTTYKTSSSGHRTKKTQKVSVFYYVIKDMESFDMYYGNDKEKLEKSATSNPATALKKTLKLMQKHYNWQKN